LRLEGCDVIDRDARVQLRYEAAQLRRECGRAPLRPLHQREPVLGALEVGEIDDGRRLGAERAHLHVCHHAGDLSLERIAAKP
jgi:hypothetical protein